MARPSKWNDDYNEQAYKLTLLGATDVQLADFFGISESTLNEWKHSKEGFSESLKKGKTVADAQVADSLYNRALGFTIKEQNAFKVKNIYYEDGSKVEKEEIEIIEIEKELPPDTTSMIFWLKNRQSRDWRDKQDIEHSGRVQVDNTFNIVEPDGNSEKT